MEQKNKMKQNKKAIPTTVAVIMLLLMTIAAMGAIFFWNGAIQKEDIKVEGTCISCEEQPPEGYKAEFFCSKQLDLEYFNQTINTFLDKAVFDYRYGITMYRNVENDFVLKEIYENDSALTAFFIVPIGSWTFYPFAVLYPNLIFLEKLSDYCIAYEKNIYNTSLGAELICNKKCLEMSKRWVRKEVKEA